MLKKFCRSVAMLLSLITIFQMLPSDIFAENNIKALNNTPKKEADKSANHADNNIPIERIDFSTKRLLIRTDDASLFPEDANILAQYGDVYLLGFENEVETKNAYTLYSEKADFVDADIALHIADNDFLDDNGDPITENEYKSVNDVIDGTAYDIAMIDTGVANDAAPSASVIGGEGVDDNGHGTSMLDAVISVSNTLSVLSIKAFDGHGVGYLSDIYAAIMLAMEKNVHVISMSFAAERNTSGASLDYAVNQAKKAGIIVVGAAGNNDTDASLYLPGCLENVYIAGACDERGIKLDFSNHGENVFCNVVSGSTSEAAAKLSAIIALYGEENISATFNNGIIFEKNYDAPEPVYDEFKLEEHTDLLQSF